LGLCRFAELDEVLQRNVQHLAASMQFQQGLGGNDMLSVRHVRQTSQDGRVD
jgi:hypothetical protein